jgi:transposase-like protein
MKSGVVSGASWLARITELSREATRRLKWFDYYNSHGQNARLTCRYFGINPQTFYRWKRRNDSRRLESLDQLTWSSELAQEALRLREEYPKMG